MSARLERSATNCGLAETDDREADLSTEQIGAQTPTRFPRPHGNHRRPQGRRSSARARPQAAQRLEASGQRPVPRIAVPAARAALRNLRAKSSTEIICLPAPFGSEVRVKARHDGARTSPAGHQLPCSGCGGVPIFSRRLADARSRPQLLCCKRSDVRTMTRCGRTRTRSEWDLPYHARSARRSSATGCGGACGRWLSVRNAGMWTAAACVQAMTMC